MSAASHVTSAAVQTADPQGNEKLTAMTGAILLVLFAAEVRQHSVTTAATGCDQRLRWAGSRRHPRWVRHATDEDLDRAEALLVELRALPQLRERKRGSFSRGSRAFLHFHEDAGDLYVDVRLDSKFDRLRVTTSTEQSDCLVQVRAALAQPSS
jgi:hypothetical protein